MRKIAFSVSLLLISAAAGIVSAQEATTTAIAPEETITIEDLGISDAGILPTSPFYFFKEFGRNVQGFFTFNQISKAELELKFANEKAAEVKKITETQPENTKAIQKALENYQKTQTKLRERFKKLTETSQNPRVDTLLDNLTDRVVKHEKLFDEISFKFKEGEGISNAISDTMSESENIIGEASKKDDPAKFASRLEKVLLEEKGGDLKHARSIELIDRFSKKTSTEIKESFERLREEFSRKLENDIQNLVTNKGEDALKEKIANTPGDSAARSVIIEEIQKRAEERLSQTLEKVMGQLEKIIQKETDIAQKAEEQIKGAEEMIQKAEKKISESSAAKANAVVSTLLQEAREHLEDAKSAFTEEKYGEAFGQARSAEVLARNALKFFEHEEPTSTAPELKQIQSTERALPSSVVTPLNRCEEITKNILRLKELLASGGINESDFKAKYDSRLRDLIVCQGEKNTVAPIPPTVISPTPVSPTPTACTLEYSPVCGSNGKTYSNACHAKIAGITAIYRGECKTEKDETEIEKPESIAPKPTVKPLEPVNSTEAVKSIGY